MMHISQAVVVEGRYDKIKLDSAVDAIIVTTDGFNIFKDTEKQEYIRFLAGTAGIIVLTDSDEAGFRIRRFVRDLAANGKCFDAYVPDISGKEKRKSSPGAAGILGVEGIDVDIILKALRDSVPFGEGSSENLQNNPEELLTPARLFEDGFTGTAGASERRRRLLVEMGLPSRLSVNALINTVNRVTGISVYERAVKEIDNDTL